MLTAGAQIDEVHGKTPLRANGQVDPFRRRACPLNVDLVGEDLHERGPGVQVAAVVAVGGLFAVFATISRKGRRGLDAGAKGYGATDSSVDALLA